jgi:hypothetical protein
MPTQTPASLNGPTAISAALDRLQRLATAIRRSSIEGQRDKLVINFWKTDEDTYLESCIQNFIRDRFHSARSSLIDQLTMAVCAQRKRLQYLPQHNRRLAAGLVNNRKRKRDGPNLLVKAVYGKQLQLKDSAHTEPIHQETALTAKTAVTATDASIPGSQVRGMLVKLLNPALSVMTTGSSMVEGETIHYPDPPRISKQETFHPCQYCAEPLPASKLDSTKNRNDEFWR